VGDEQSPSQPGGVGDCADVSVGDDATDGGIVLLAGCGASIAPAASGAATADTSVVSAPPTDAPPPAAPTDVPTVAQPLLQQRFRRLQLPPVRLTQPRALRIISAWSHFREPV
jgi:hypothetical protein